MDKQLAGTLMSELVALSGPMNRATALVMQLPNEDEKKALLHSIGSIMNIAYTELMRPIIIQYPDLDPDRDHRM